MKRFFATLLAVGMVGGSAYAQSQMLDDFEAGVDTAEWTIQGFQGETASHLTTDGADGSTASMRLTDDGFSFFIFRLFEEVVAAEEDGIYRLTFWYKSDVDNAITNQTMRNFSIQANGVPVGAVTGGTPGTIENWTFFETDSFLLDELDDLEVRFVAGNGGVDVPWHILVDEVFLEKLEAEPITMAVRPINGDWLGEDTTITVRPNGGTGTYTQVEFDLGNTGTVDATDSVGPEEFTFLLEIPAIAEDGDTIDLRIIVTDSADTVEERVVTYTFVPDAGRETLFTSDFESWDGLVPDGWNLVDIDGGGEIDPSPDREIAIETDEPFGGVGSSLRLTYPTNPNPYRYTFLSDTFESDRTDYLITAALRATTSFGRIYIFTSQDGDTWVNSFQGLEPGTGNAWGYYISDPLNIGVQPYAAIATHFFNPGTFWVDDVIVTSAEEVIETSNPTWDLY